MRGCGVLLHITSLPGKGGIGSLGDDATAFVDFLASAGQSWWQVLPLTPPAQNNSPYSSFSVFAGNPALINLETLEKEGLLAFWARKFLPRQVGEPANYEYCQKIHLPMLRQSFASGYEKHKEEVAAFRRENAFWLEDYALYMALRQKYGEDTLFQDWPEEARTRVHFSIPDEIFAREVDFWVWTQYLFFRQWYALKAYANKKGIGIIGDMPFYPNADSADVWAHPTAFQLDASGRPRAVAGVPPDDFSPDGQLWGNPLYDWDGQKKNDYRWWMERLAHAHRMYDRVRIDHFRALDEYFAVSADATTAREGRWLPGPDMDFLEAVYQKIPRDCLVAEDLGNTTPTLQKLLSDSGLPGMKILQFGFDPDGDSAHMPHHIPKNCVAYTGTHDNDTVMGWTRSASSAQLRFAREYLQLSHREGYHWGFVRGLYASCAETVIVPMQDLLGLGSAARMNTPGIPTGQWTWRVNGRHLSGRLAERMRELADCYRRLPAKAQKTAPK